MSDAEEMVTWLLEANPAKRLEYLLQKYGKQIDALDPINMVTHREGNPEWNAWVDAEKARIGSPIPQTKQLISDIVNKVDPTKGDYSEWIVRQWLKLTPDQRKRWHEDEYKVHDDLELFHKYKGKMPADQRDINRYSFRMMAATAQGSLKELAKEDQVQRSNNAKASEIEVLLNDAAWRVLIPKSKEASIKYGQGTRWCTASERYSYYEQYTKDGPLFIIIKKSVPYTNLQTGETSSNEEEKWQLHLETEQFMDAADDALDPEAFFASHPEPGKAIGAWLKANYTPENYAKYISLVDPSVVLEILATGTPEQAQPLLMRTSLPLVIGGIQSKKLSPERLNPMLVHAWHPHAAKMGLEFLPEALKVAMSGSDLVDCFDKNSRKLAEAVYGDDPDVFDHWDFQSDVTYSTIRSRYLKLTAEQEATIKRIVLDWMRDHDEEDVENWEDYADECEGVTEALQRADEEGQRHGAESEVYDAVKSAFEEEVGKTENGATVNGVQAEWVVTINYRRMLDLCNTAREEDGSKVTPSALNVEQLVAIKIEEPRYGYSGFNDESFSERLNMELDEIDPGEPEVVPQGVQQPAMSEALKLVRRFLR